MPAANPPMDASLEDWNAIDPELTTSGLILGNGASRAIWDSFAYDSLYERAKLLPSPDALTSDDVAVFNSYDTTNFEGVLQALATADKVLVALGKPDQGVKASYSHVRNALVASVHATHVPHALLPPQTLETLAHELGRYEFVYSTNYDLIVYWAVMHVGASKFKDFFWCDGTCFNLANSDAWGKPTKLLFVHGGLHIYVDQHGNTCKHTAGNVPILEQFMAGTTVPVFVSEGNSSDKLRSIYRSDYLSFAYLSLMRHTGPLVILGQGMGESDQHIVAAINKARPAEIIIGLLRAGDPEIRSQKTHYQKCFPNSTLTFFDALSHPMAGPGLKVQA